MIGFQYVNVSLILTTRFSCDQEGHMARKCPEPRRMTNECYNCGEVGQDKADYPNLKVSGTSLENAEQLLIYYIVRLFDILYRPALCRGS